MVVPDLSSLAWIEIAEPLLAFLTKKPASIEDILGWRRCNRMTGDMVRSALAWLSLTGKVYFDDQGLKWTAGCVLKPEDIYVSRQASDSKTSSPVNMELLLRFLESHPASSRLRIWKPILPPKPGRKSGVIRRLTLGNKTQTISQWAIETGISATAIWSRVLRGWTDEKALTEPVHAKNRHSIAKEGSP